MKINIGYCSINYYDKKTIYQWFWKYRKYKYVKGFFFRIFGFYINIRENNATEKLIKLAQKSF